jgi:hypothetical protein
MDQPRVLRVTAVEGFGPTPLKIAFIADLQLIREVDFDHGTPGTSARGQVQIIIKGEDGEILGSLSVNVSSLPNEGSYWLPLADCEDDFISEIPEECHSPCIQLEIKADKRPQSKPEKKAEEVKPELTDRSAKTKVLSLEQALKAERWKRQELADNFKRQMDDASFKTVKLQALLKKASEKLVETEAKINSDQLKTTEHHQSTETTIAELAAKLEAEQAEALSKDQEIIRLTAALAEVTLKSEEESSALHDEVSSLQVKLTAAQEVTVAQADEMNEQMQVLTDELDLCKLMIRSQKQELERALDKELIDAENDLKLKLKGSEGKVEDLKQCITELYEQNKLLADELADVQSALAEYTRAKSDDPAAEAELRAFLKKMKLESKVRAQGDGKFIMHDVVVRPVKRANQLIVSLECSLSFLEKCANTSRSLSISSKDIPRRRASITPLRDNRISHKRNMTASGLEGDVGLTKKAKEASLLEISFESKPKAAKHIRTAKLPKENKTDRWASSPISKLDESIDSSLQSLKVELQTSARKKMPFK